MKTRLAFNVLIFQALNNIIAIFRDRHVLLRFPEIVVLGFSDEVYKDILYQKLFPLDLHLRDW